MNNYKIRINFSHHYTRHILVALKTTGADIEHDPNIKPEFIYVNDELVGYIAWWDSLKFTPANLKDMAENDFKIIFKFHYSPNVIDYSIYGKYEDRIVPCGLWRTWETEDINYKWNKHNIMTRPRPIDVTAQMRHINSSKNWYPWSHIRFQLKNLAKSMNDRGFNTSFKMIGRKDYEKKLLDTNTAFIWSATSYLGWKVCEFLEQGVIMITEPLGKDYPLCNGVVLEDDVHCVFCNDPNQFEAVVKQLLADPVRVNRIRKNILDLWESKLTQKHVGRWYLNKIIETYEAMQTPPLNISWFQKTGKNWGDALNPVLAKYISGKNINWVKWGESSNEQRYYCIGSILQSSMSEGTEVWGTGLMRYEDKLRVKPKKIHAVRGPLTRQSLLEQGFDCPEVYGDPALLYPRYYNPTIEKTYKWGIIPHYVDQKHPWLNRFRNMKNVKIINILDPINKVVDEIKSCEKIISSSLHGIVAADSYDVPSKWIILSEKIGGMERHNGKISCFKFRDYFESVKRTDIDPILCTPNIRLMDIEKEFVDYKIDIDLDLLYDACPFKQS